MKIAIISPGAIGGGAERVAQIISEYLASKGHDIMFIYMREADCSFVRRPGIKYLCIDNKKISGLKKYLYKCKRVKKEVENFGAKAFISFVIDEVLFLTMFGKLKKIVSLRNDPKRMSKKLYTKIIRFFVFHFANKIIFQTPDARDYFSKTIRKKGVIIHNPISQELPYWNKTFYKQDIITACRLEPQKNIYMLINVFDKISKEIKNIRLVIYGEGNEREDLENYAYKIKKNKQIVFPGYSHNIHEIMSKSMIFVLTSDYEGISNSMLEALAIGIPTICTDCPVGGAKMFIKDGENGYLIKVKDENELYKKLLKLIKNESIRINFSKESVKIRDELKLTTIGNQWEKEVL